MSRDSTNHLTLADIDHLIKDVGHKLDEIFISRTDFIHFKRANLASNITCDSLGEFFWHLTTKVRPMPVPRAAMIVRQEKDNEYILLYPLYNIS